MRILMTADAVGGVWTYAIELARALPDIDFTIATMGRRPTDAQRADVPPNAQLVESDFKLEWEDEPWNDVINAGAWLLDLEARLAPDVIHINGYAHGALPFRTPKIVVAHSCVSSWWLAVNGRNTPREWDHYREAVTRGLNGASVVVAPSAWMLGELDRHYRFRARTRLIYNGRSYTPSISHDRASVFAAGRLWDEAKNLGSVLAAAPRIDWPVRIAGDGGITSPNVTPLGRLDSMQMARAYGSSGIYLFPARYEPFGLSILEAALSGCALVLGDIPSLREIWRDAALFVSPLDTDAIAQTVNELIANDALRGALAERARDRARLFTIERMASSYRSTYESLIHPNAPLESVAIAHLGASS